MKKILTAAFVVLALVMAVGVQKVWSDSVAGYVMDVESYPDMLKKQPDCNKAYEDYLYTVHQVQACHDLKEAKENQAIQQAIADDFSSMGKCKNCEKGAGHAKQLAAHYGEQASEFGSACPGDDDAAKLKDQLPAKEKQVCKSCKKKWPGKVSPQDKTPCD